MKAKIFALTLLSTITGITSIHASQFRKVREKLVMDSGIVNTSIQNQVEYKGDEYIKTVADPTSAAAHYEPIHQILGLSKLKDPKKEALTLIHRIDHTSNNMNDILEKFNNNYGKPSGKEDYLTLISKKIDTLNEELNSAKEDLAIKQTEFDNLSDALTELTITETKLNKELDEINKAGTQEKLNEALKQRDASLAEIKKLKDEKNTEIDSLKNTIEKLTAKEKQLTDDLGIQTTKFNTLNTAYNETHADLEKTTQDYNIILEQNKQLSSLITTVASHIFSDKGIDLNNFVEKLNLEKGKEIKISVDDLLAAVKSVDTSSFGKKTSDIITSVSPNPIVKPSPDDGKKKNKKTAGKKAPLTTEELKKQAADRAANKLKSIELNKKITEAKEDLELIEQQVNFLTVDKVSKAEEVAKDILKNTEFLDKYKDKAQKLIEAVKGADIVAKTTDIDNKIASAVDDKTKDELIAQKVKIMEISETKLDDLAIKFNDAKDEIHLELNITEFETLFYGILLIDNSYLAKTEELVLLKSEYETQKLVHNGDVNALTEANTKYDEENKKFLDAQNKLKKLQDELNGLQKPFTAI